jgi:hypothetical protein
LQIYKTLYFAFAATWGYLVLKNEDSLPTWLFGHGNMTENGAEIFSKDYPAPKWPKGMKYYYLCTMGYHIH